MASEQLKTVLELVGRAGLGTLTLPERRALMGSAGAPPPAGTQVDPVDANGVPAEWVAAPGVTNLGGDAACLARGRRAAAGGGRGRRADRRLAARGSATR